MLRTTFSAVPDGNHIANRRHGMYGRAYGLIGTESLDNSGLGVRRVIGACVFSAALITVTILVGIQSAHATEIGPFTTMAETEATVVLQQRVEQIEELRAANLANFDAMERSPGLYTVAGNANEVLQDRTAEMIELRAKNLAVFEEMERNPGLYTKR
jgi:hypothetical protein